MFTNLDFYSYVLLPFLIFIARITDVSLGTLRIIFISKGMRKITPFIGFFEVLIWIIAISRIMENLNNWTCYIAYAAGFATGNFVGMYIEQKLAIGYEMVRVITRKEPYDLVNTLKYQGYGVTLIKAEGIEGEVGVIYVIVNRNKLENIIDIIKQYNPNALYTIEGIRFVNKEIYHKYNPIARKRLLGF